MRLLRTTTLLAAVAVGATLAGAATAAATPDLDWAQCGENAAVECATITVPIDWSRPHGDTIEVAVARRAVENPIGTLFYLPGGPGDSGVRRLLDRDPLPDEIGSRFDVVSFDPRGTNRSAPVTCDAELVANLPVTNPDAGATLAGMRDYARALGESCREHTGPLLDHLDSVSVARDVDAIRAALGERELSLYGRSYGTLAGAMYAERYPHRVRALVLDSVFDHSLSPRRFLWTQTATGEDSFREFASWCDRAEECALHGQDVDAVYDTLYAKSVAGELVDPTSGGPVRPMDLVNRTVSFFYGPSSAEAAVFLRSLADGAPAARVAAEETEPFPVAAFCADHRVSIRSERQWQRLWAQQNRAAPTLRTHFAWLPVTLCSAWPAETNNPQHRLDIDHTPVLVLNSAHDPATSIEWARNVTRQIDHGRLLTYEGWGHGVVDRTPCTVEATTRYLVDLELPRRGATCPADRSGG
ncbi:alpha/beta hydrolase [Actinophytocola gossypii]|uniref:Alpha/beta fold hydrolase n=1 Tax=Actinophytocola gossypii TaxID=2812003 RepID=A0ABT2J3X6_9PSEU|nr:alpha/beta hydrolase [Actinophytocola gossypii]MCT2582483.1 alpha/beta fold hydrolase [Actinophytocola gossypii]